MKREDVIAYLKVLSNHLFNDESEANISKVLGYLYVKYLANQNGEILQKDEVLDFCVDGTNDCEIDYIYYHNTERELKVNIIQTKYSNLGDTSISAPDLQKFRDGVDNFPNHKTRNSKLSTIQNEINKYTGSVIKEAHYINFGNITNDATNILQMMPDCKYLNFDTFISFIGEVDVMMPDLKLKFLKDERITILQNDGGIIGVVSVKNLLEDNEEYLSNGTAFSKNIRGQINNELSKEILNTVKDSPDTLFAKNNGLTIICSDYEDIESIGTSPKKYTLIKRASIINGQQTILSILRYYKSNKTSLSENAYLMCKIIKTDNDEMSTLLAQTSNSQTKIPSRALYVNVQKLTNRKKIAATVTPDDFKFYMKLKSGIDHDYDTSLNNIIELDDVIIYLNILKTGEPTEDKKSLDEKLLSLFEDEAEYPTANIKLLDDLLKYISNVTRGNRNQNLMESWLLIYKAKATINKYILCVFYHCLKENRIDINDMFKGISNKANNTPRYGNSIEQYTGIEKVIQSSIEIFERMVNKWVEKAEGSSDPKYKNKLLSRDKIRRQFDIDVFKLCFEEQVKFETKLNDILVEDGNRPRFLLPGMTMISSPQSLEILIPNT